MQLAFAWKQFQCLYLSGPARTALLDEAAGGFFGIIQEVLLESLFLHLSVLSDPPSNGTHENLSFERLAASVKPELIDSGAWPQAEQLLTEFKNQVVTIRRHRNKRIAHADLATVVEPKTTPLDDVTLSQLRNAVKQAFATFNALCYPLSGISHDGFEEVIIAKGDAEALVGAIEAATQHRKLKLWLWDGNAPADGEAILQRFFPPHSVNLVGRKTKAGDGT